MGGVGCAESPSHCPLARSQRGSGSKATPRPATTGASRQPPLAAKTDAATVARSALATVSRNLCHPESIVSLLWI